MREVPNVDGRHSQPRKRGRRDRAKKIEKTSTVEYNTFHVYRKCMDRCRWNYLATRETKGRMCDAPFMPVDSVVIQECEEYDVSKDLFDIYQEWYDPGSDEHCDGECVSACDIKMYSARIIKQEQEDALENTFHIYFPSGQVQVTQQQQQQQQQRQHFWEIATKDILFFSFAKDSD